MIKTSEKHLLNLGNIWATIMKEKKQFNSSVMMER